MGILQARIPECHALLQGDLPLDLPCPGIEPGSPALQADSLLLSPQGSPMKDSVWRASRLVKYMEIWGTWSLQIGHGSAPVLHTLPFESLPSGCFWITSFYNKPVILYTGCFSEFCEPLANDSNPSRGISDL